MQCYYIDLYTDFSCLAGACPSTCCSGWKIIIDAEAMQRFSSMENQSLKEDIFSHIQERNGEYCFQNEADGRCSMLDDDGLCRIQRNLTEKDLCNTCRKFPRLSRKVENRLWLSMAASCPVVAGYLWKQEIRWMKKDARNFSEPLEIKELPVVQEGLAFYASQKEQLEQKNLQGERLEGKEKVLWHVKKQWSRFLLFLEVVDGVLEIAAEFPEQKYLTEYLDYFEKEDQKVIEIVEDMDIFEEKWQQKIDRFIVNYLSYRLYSRKLEDLQESLLQNYTQTLGELAIFYIITFSRYFKKGELSEEDIIENINITYRFCAHGRISSQKISQRLDLLFEETEDYLYLLQG